MAMVTTVMTMMKLNMSSEEYESQVDSGDDNEDQGPSVPPKRRKFNRVYFIED